MGKREETRRFWTEIVDRYRRAGVTRAAFAAGQGVGLAALQYWISKLGRETRGRELRQQAAVTLVPVRVRRAPAAPLVPQAGRVEVRLGQISVRVPVGTDPEYLAGVVSALRAAPC